MPSRLDNRSKMLDVRREFKILNLKSYILHPNRPAFTLIELLVVISIIAILLAVATVSYSNSQEKGRDNRRKSDLKAVQQALEFYFQQNGKYPNTGTGATSNKPGRIQCNVGTDTSVKEWGTEFSCDPDGAGAIPKVVYMNPLPKDPSFVPSTDKDYYYNTTTTTTYILSAKIENLKDDENADRSTYPASPTLPCTPQGYTSPNPSGTNKSYCVINP